VNARHQIQTSDADLVSKDRYTPELQKAASRIAKCKAKHDRFTPLPILDVQIPPIVHIKQLEDKKAPTASKLISLVKKSLGEMCIGIISIKTPDGVSHEGKRVQTLRGQKLRSEHWPGLLQDL
jgi:hypothetical protein